MLPLPPYLLYYDKDQVMRGANKQGFAYHS